MDEHFKTIRETIEQQIDGIDTSAANRDRRLALAAVAILEQVVTDLHTIATEAKRRTTNADPA